MTGKKDNSELLAEVEALRKEVALLHEANAQLIARNMVLAEQVEMGYEVRRRIDWLKELIRKHREFMKSADKKDDSELLAEGGRVAPNLAMPRKQEIFACLNRCRSLCIKS